MQQDFDSLYSIVTDYYSNIPLIEERCGISVEKKYRELRDEISTINSTFEFTNIVRRLLNVLNDGHTSITNKSSVKWYAVNSYLKDVSNVTLSDTLKADYYFSLVSDSIFPIIKSGLRVKYFDGKYYNVRPFTYNGEEINSGEEVVSIDGVSINDFVLCHYDQMFSLMWDPNKKQWYSDFFMLSLPLLGKETFKLKISDKDVIINSNIILDNLQKEKYSIRSQPNVCVIDDKILYVYLPIMMNKEWYINEILKKYTPGINKIIFDLRGNSGGDDSVWSEILSVLINNTIHYEYRVNLNYHESLEKSISPFGEININDGVMTVFRNRAIQPSENGLNFDGSFYILQDKYTYSAASAFVACAMQNKNRFTVIGERSALISGYTFPPLIFKLRNSGIAFKLGFSYDISGGNENKYMDNVDIEVYENIHDYLEKLYTFDSNSEWYISNVDKLVQIIKDSI